MYFSMKQPPKIRINPFKILFDRELPKQIKSDPMYRSYLDDNVTYFSWLY